VIVVSDSSPLITLDKLGRLDLLQQLFTTITIPEQVYMEVVVSGYGMAGADSTAAAKWIHVQPLPNASELSARMLGFQIASL